MKLLEGLSVIALGVLTVLVSVQVGGRLGWTMVLMIVAVVWGVVIGWLLKRDW